MTSSQNDPTALTQSFHYKTSTHSYDVKWDSLGDPKSPPLIFIHGTPWSSRVWVPFALSLSRQFHVYLFDRPGFGDTPAEKKLDPTKASSNAIEEYDSNLARQAEVFAALFKSWQADWTHEKAHIVAHDNAGLVSLRAYLLHDLPYASLCLIDVVAIGPFGQPLFKVIAENPQLFEQLPGTAFEGILESYISDAAYYELPKETTQMLKEPWLREGGKRGFIRELCQANSRSTEEVEARYGEVGPKLPIKIIWGADDKWLPVEVAHRLGDALKAREVIVIDKAGHLSMIDQGARVGVELGLWLSTALHKQ
ncbi:related to hydrolases or acyltransferases (alpha/beta hydrolase superfamily) [Fusarium fujikuroi]|nr:hydrolase or acyltransferase (alpha/beta hydrolase superfamily) [Fusarium fujikuroi]SCN64471.1 related to hydrolases or acyltransferases (alpha/beta hydrolase superfamily) [Fusarium fujikuroi]SCN71111.1 related to hydrolases or acyltransferases (alpha/beta hydrolase superfamily) [Fusarium fujikuroi]SCO14356.1 related to hydrolases or acyltransferases (alpha/beta hydrolase superfamily) [Fusarium fujikuroi]SCO57465.1 related to hydrolases or acyltransferases (alpha/beta hydrolase superfamily) 